MKGAEQGTAGIRFSDSGCSTVPPAGLTASLQRPFTAQNQMHILYGLYGLVRSRPLFTGPGEKTSSNPIRQILIDRLLDRALTRFDSLRPFFCIRSLFVSLFIPLIPLIYLLSLVRLLFPR